MKFTCPHCQQNLEADDSLNGSSAECPVCGKPFVLEGEQTEGAVQAAPSADVSGESSMSESAQESNASRNPENPSAPKATPNFRVVSPAQASSPNAGSAGGDGVARPETQGKKVECPHCFSQFEVDPSLLGMYADCPSCGKRFRVLETPSEGGNSGGDGNERLSMTVPLVFQSIVLGLMALATLCFATDALDAMEGIAWIFSVIAILNIVFTTVFHYKCWSKLPAGFARLPPGQAAGFLFIPFYNLYWAFPSVGGLGADCVECAKSKGMRGYNYLRPLGLTLAILMCVGGALWTLCCLSMAGNFLEEVVDDIGYFGIIPWCWSLGGAPVAGLLVGIAKFVIWLLFYRGVTRLLNAPAPTASSAPRP